MVHNEILYRSSIFFEVHTGNTEQDGQSNDRICDKALSEGSPFYPGVEVSADYGGPCWGPNVIITGDNEEHVKQVAQKVESYAKRFKGIKFF